MMLLLVDGTNIACRYAHAMLGEKQDEPGPGPADVNRVVRSIERALWRCAADTQSTHAIICFDSGDSWRKELYPEYKANRDANGGTGAWSAHLLDWLSPGWKCADSKSFEADDLIATLALRAERAGHCVAVLSGDSDLLQLSGEMVAVHQFGRKDEPRFPWRDPGWIAEKYGLPLRTVDGYQEGDREPAWGEDGRYEIADLVRFYKALVGEPGDNLPGVPGIGPVKAKALLSTLPADWTRFDVQAELRERLDASQRESFDLACRLVGLRKDVPLEPILPSACRVPINPGDC